MKRFYKHSFANYPTGFKGCVVSPTKICLQFENPEIKLRVNAEDRSELPKLPEGGVYLPIAENGTMISITAVGCQMPIVEEYQMALIDAYKHYYRTHNQTYKEKYNKEFKDFIKRLQAKINNLVSIIEKGD